MVVIADVFHFEMSWLNADAPENTLERKKKVGGEKTEFDEKHKERKNKKVM